MNSFRKRFVIQVPAFGALVLLAGCSSKTVGPPPELVQARAAYNESAAGPTARFAPGDLEVAKRSLDRAEAMYKNQDDAVQTRGQAYVALRRAQIADANANTRIAQAQRDQAAVVAINAQARRAAADAAALQQSRGATSLQGMAQGEKCQLEFPAVAFFDTGKAELSVTARGNLDVVVQAFKDDDRKIRINGFADTTGTDSVNEPLSNKRADAVRDYLSSHGIDRSRIEVSGNGSNDPIATNATAPGRAANRRASIMIEPKTGVAEPMPSK